MGGGLLIPVGLFVRGGSASWCSGGVEPDDVESEPEDPPLDPDDMM